jgi:hypothetical protein
MFSYYFEVLVLKKNLKIYFNIFLNKKYFELLSLSQSQTNSKLRSLVSI